MLRGDIMTNLTNLDISKIRYNGNEVILMRLNGFTVYEAGSPYIEPYMEYTIDNTITDPLNYLEDWSDIGTGFYFCHTLPRIYTNESSYSYNYDKVEITLLDGTITDDLTTTCDQIEKVRIWYPKNTYAVSFSCEELGNFAGDYTQINYFDASNIVSMKDMFSSCFDLTNVNIVNTSKVTNMSYMFYNCSDLTSLDVSNWDTSNVETMKFMFASCDSLVTLDLSSFNTSKVEIMEGMFLRCLVSELDVSNFDTSKVTTMSRMFFDCNKLTSLNVSNWDTGNVTNMTNMFRDCKSLTQLDASNFDTSNVETMGGMFANCYKLTSLDLSNFDTSNVTTMNSMFDNCKALHTLRLDNCSKDTISMIITSSNFPTNAIEGGRYIYCKRANAAGLVEPTNWTFSYID